MEKKVYCLIGERCKRITFSSTNYISDAQIVRATLIEASSNDIVLQSMLKNKEIILQKFDTDRNNKLCDVEEDDEIEDKSEINVLLYEKPSNLVLESSPSTSFISDVSQERQIDDTYNMNVKILHTEPVDIQILHAEPVTNLEDVKTNEKSLCENIQNSAIVTEKIKEKVTFS